MSAPLVVGNWKMHGTQSECFNLGRAIARALRRKPAETDVVLAPPFTGLAQVRRALREATIGLAAQNCHWADSGAYTGETSAAMIADIGCQFVILGHSERRRIFLETDAMIAHKIGAALRHRLRPILCVGETLAERRAGQTAKVVSRQLRIALKGLTKDVIENVEIAYEPVWAIGTGQNASPEQVGQVHGRIRRFLIDSFGQSTAMRVRILYGGSVNPDNVNSLIPVDGVNGLLVGGASLKAETFLPIIRSFANKVRA
ncbi:MAG TPA: triose-phosphate isomerase [Candidatus Binatia bacterium]|nr:triose-phosphate isomerase [Candidatus Binatia bacterium]